MIYGCCDRRRRKSVSEHPSLNGIDYIEVIDRELADDDPLRQRTLLLHCLKSVAALGTGDLRQHVRISGGERIKTVAVEWAFAASSSSPDFVLEPQIDAIVGPLADKPNVLVIRTRETGDFSTYTLSLLASAQEEDPLAPFDPELAGVTFSFKVACPSDFDCKPAIFCPPAAAPTTDIDYLAKDYASFRRLLLDRVSQLAPSWTDSSAADQGVMLAELLAYVGDHLSYQQDAIATEAYLGTARRRVSLRRHALLVDYPMHDGCNARAWLHLQVQEGVSGFKPDVQSLQFLTLCPGSDDLLEKGSPELATAMLASPTVFEPLFAPTLAVPTLHEEHNQIEFYTWGDTRCCLPRGATHATLVGPLPHLEIGDALLFEEIRGPETGVPGDADPRHRHVVRVTWMKKHSSGDPNTPLTDPLTGTPVVEIDWASEDALPFALCISAEPDGLAVSVARGNLLLADHGLTVPAESLGTVPAPKLFEAPSGAADRCNPPPRIALPPRFRPRLANEPLTQAGTVLVKRAHDPDGKSDSVPFDPAAPAAEALGVSLNDVVPQLSLSGVFRGVTTKWSAKRTLLGSDGSEAAFVAEIEDDGTAILRYGDDQHGKRPETDTTFTARYRVGNGAAGNVGADSIRHIVASQSDLARLLSVRNPLPAAGGVDPESSASVRRNAPRAFRTQERAVTADDYARVAERQKGVQRAAAGLRWTGSWYTVFLTADPEADADPQEIREALPRFVDRFRMAGHDLELSDPQYVPLEIDLDVCVADGYFRSDVRSALLETLGSRDLPDGRRGLFHPDNLTFGQSVFLSPLFAICHAVPGVVGVEVTTFRRLGTDDTLALENGAISLGALEIARLDNNPSFPERGVLRLDLHGGK